MRRRIGPFTPFATFEPFRLIDGGASLPPVPVALAAEWSYDGPMTETEDADYTYWRLDQTDSATLTVTKAGYLWIHARGQGGPGGGGFFAAAGGGGAGEVTSQVVYLNVGTYVVTMPYDNLGGVTNQTAPVKGSDTVVATITAVAGGIGSSNRDPSAAGDGAAGGGQGTKDNVTNPIGRGTVGFDGGVGLGSPGQGYDSGAGGGGLGSAGGDEALIADATSGPGGDPITDTFFGVPELVGEGGGGGAIGSGALSPIPQAGGGRGGSNSNGSDAIAGTASGGGGSGNTGNGGRGSSPLGGIRIPKVEAWSIIEAASVSGPTTFYLANTDFATATIPVSGTVVGADQVIQARVVDANGVQVTAWGDLATSSSGAFSGSLTIPPTAGYLRAEYRFRDAPAIVWPGGTWRAGLQGLIYGQSNAERYWSIGPYNDLETLVMYEAAAADYRVPGPGIRQFGVSMTAAIGWSLRMIVAGVGGAGSEFLTNPNGAPVTEIVAALGALGGRLDFVQINQGEGNVAVQVQRDRWASDWEGFVSLVATTTGQALSSLPVFTTSLMTFGGIVTEFQTDYNWSEMRTIQFDTFNDIAKPTWHWCGPGLDLTRNDEYHLIFGGYAFRAEREAAVICGVLGFTAAVNLPVIASAVASGGTNTVVTITHGDGTDFTFGQLNHVTGTPQDITTVSSIDTFEVSVDGGATWVPTTGVRTNATTITLTHAGIGAGARTLRYAYGMNPGIVVRDNSGLNWPLQYTT